MAGSSEWFHRFAHSNSLSISFCLLRNPIKILRVYCLLTIGVSCTDSISNECPSEPELVDSIR